MAKPYIEITASILSSMAGYKIHRNCLKVRLVRKQAYQTIHMLQKI